MTMQANNPRGAENNSVISSEPADPDDSIIDDDPDAVDEVESNHEIEMTNIKRMGT